MVSTLKSSNKSEYCQTQRPCHFAILLRKICAVVTVLHSERQTIISMSFTVSQRAALEQAAPHRCSTDSLAPQIPSQASPPSMAKWQWCVLMGNDSLIEPVDGLEVICFEKPGLTGPAFPHQLPVKLTINHLITFTPWQFFRLPTFYWIWGLGVCWQGWAF